MENKTITIYELLGLIKEGKAPEKIQHNDIIWNYTSSFKDYYYNGNYFFNNETLAGKLWILEHLNDTVEILDDIDDEFEESDCITSKTINYCPMCGKKLRRNNNVEN
jgi:hypothetical protein